MNELAKILNRPVTYAQVIRLCRVSCASLASLVLRSRVVPISFSRCHLTEAHACARLERRVGRVLRTLVGGYLFSYTSEQ